MRKAVELVGVADIEGHRRRQELDGVVGLEVSGLVSDQGIGRGVGLVEAVAREFGDELENIFGARPVHTVGHGTFDEARLLRRHLLLDLLAHGAAQEIRFAEREARQLARDLHHLLLIDDDAVSLLEDRLDQRMQIIGCLASMLPVHVGVDIVHRARPVECDDGDDVLEAVGLELTQRIAHALTFELEHAQRIAALQQLVSGCVVEREACRVELDAPPPQQHARGLDHGQRFQAQKVELHEASGFRPFHVELGRRQLGPCIAIERHELDQGTVGDDDAGGVGRGVAVKPFEPLADIEELGHDRLGVARLLQPRLGGDGLRQGDRIGGVVGDELAQAVHLAIGHLQHATDVA